MIFRYWLQVHRLWYMPWKFKIYEWYSYEVEKIIKNEYGLIEPIASVAYSKTGRYIEQLFSTKNEAEKFIYNYNHFGDCKICND